MINSSICLAGVMGLPRNFNFKDTIIGHGNKKYRLDKEWSQADVAKNPVNDCHEMVQDSKGRILLLTNDIRNNVLIYDKAGKILDYWGTEYPGAHGLTLFDENGTEVLFICDNNRHQVIKTTMDGRVLMTLDYPKEPGEYDNMEEYIPTETCIAPNGDIYVADGYGKDFIIQYDAKGNYIRHFGGRSESEEGLLNAHGICIDTRSKLGPKLIVSSRQQHCFKQYSMKGDYLGSIPLPGAWVCRPVIHGSHLYTAVLQSDNNPWKQSGFVSILDENNRVISSPGGKEPVYRGAIPEEMMQEVNVFQYPHDVCVDDEENLYVAQWNSGKSYPYKLIPV